VEGQTDIVPAQARNVLEIRVRQNGATPTHAQIWPPGLAGGPGVSALRPAGEEDQTDTDLVLADQYAREKEGRDNGATQTLAQRFGRKHWPAELKDAKANK